MASKQKQKTTSKRKAPRKAKVKTKSRKKAKHSSFKPRKIRIKVLGIGGGGASIVAEMAQNLKNVSLLVADTDARVFKKVRKGVRVFQFGEKLAGGMGTGMDPDLARKAALAEKEKIVKIFQEQDLSILVGSLGGGVASGAGPVFAEVARDQRNISLGIFTLPFNFEGEKKLKVAKNAMDKLRENLSGIIVVPNEKIFKIIDKRTPLKKSLSSLNQIFAGWLNDLIAVISKPNLINIDFADLRTILGERGKVLFFAQSMAQGPNRVEEVIKNIFQSPIFEGAPKGVRRILFNVTGGKDLKLKEVEAVSETVANLNPRAKIIFGISESPEHNGKIKLTLLAVSDKEKGEKKREASSGVSSKKRKVVRSLPKKKKKPVSVKVKSKTDKKDISFSGRDSQQKKQRKGRVRRSALEVRKAEKEAQEREWAPEGDWGVPAFLRKKGK